MPRGQGRKRGQIRRQRQSVDNQVESARRCTRKFTKGIPQPSTPFPGVVFQSGYVIHFKIK